MKKNFDEEKARIIVTIIPFVLIIIILAITLIVKTTGKHPSDENDLQETIKEYADQSGQDQLISNETLNDDSTLLVKESPSSTPEQDKGEEAEASPSPYVPVMDVKVDYSKIKFDKDEQLKEMMTYWADNNQKAIDDLAGLDRFRAMSYQLKDTTDFYYYGDKDASGNPNGMGIAVYGDNQYYYGGWKDGVRSGHGTFIHYHVHQGKSKDLYTYHQYVGNFAEDLPDGEGSEHYDFDTSNFVIGNRYIANMIGSYREGMVNGEFYLTTIDINDKYEEWEGTAQKGSWDYQTENKDKKGNRTVQVDINDPNNYMWMLPANNKGIRVPCLISGKW